MNCDAPFCLAEATWFIGRELPPESGGVFSRGHSACDAHLADGCRITLTQFGFDTWEELRLDVRPYQAIVEDSKRPRTDRKPAH